MSKLNATINGITFDNCDVILPELQDYCPLEHTEYEHLCKNVYHNVQLRPEGTCQHSADCFTLIAKLNADRSC